MVGASGFEPLTPSVSGKCSPPELRAYNQKIYQLPYQSPLILSIDGPATARSRPVAGRGLITRRRPHFLRRTRAGGFILACFIKRITIVEIPVSKTERGKV